MLYPDVFRTLELVWAPRKWTQFILEKDLTPDWEMHFKPIEKLFLKTLLIRPPTMVRAVQLTIYSSVQLYIVVCPKHLWVWHCKLQEGFPDQIEEDVNLKDFQSKRRSSSRGLIKQQSSNSTVKALSPTYSCVIAWRCITRDY